jgi:hypothetical protein
VRHQPGHRALGDVDAEYEQVTVDAGRAHPRFSVANRHEDLSGS